jgi:hypothetical protein
MLGNLEKIINTINESISKHDYEKAFFILIMSVGKLDEEERVEVFIYYKKHLMNNYKK